MNNPRSREARIAGAAYLITIAAGLFAEAVARSDARQAIAIGPAGFPAAEAMLRLSVFSDLVMIAAYLIVTYFLYRLLKPTSATGAAGAALFSMTGLAMLASGLAILLAPLIEPGVAVSALRLHGQLYNLTGFFFGLYCLTTAWLLDRSRLTPKWVAGLMAIAGFAFLGKSCVTILSPGLAQRIPDVVMLASLVGEGAVALWLAAFGASAELRATDSGEV